MASTLLLPWNRRSTKNCCAGLVVVLVSLFTLGKAHAEIEFGGVIDPGLMVTQIDSVEFTPPDTTYLTPGWGSHLPLDSHDFTGVPSWPETLMLHGYVGPFPFQIKIVDPDTSRWYHIGSSGNGPFVKFYGTGYGGVEESKPSVERQQRLAVSPSVVTGQMTVRLQPSGTGRPVVEIHDVVGNVIRTLGCTAGSDGAATATWNREDGFGRLVPEGVYFCRYTAADVVAVRKVLVAH
jgi:hypothetical protein